MACAVATAAVLAGGPAGGPAGRPAWGPAEPTPAHASVAATSATAQSAVLTRATTPARLIALAWAERQHGKWYCWGGAGPSCYDCSGLVMTAYRHAGTALPRTTYGMLSSRLLRRIPARNRKPGDLAFYGTGHVELVVSASETFGAGNAGTRIGVHRISPWWYPTMYFEVV